MSQCLVLSVSLSGISHLFLCLVSLNLAFQVPGLAGAWSLREGNWNYWGVEGRGGFAGFK